MVDVQPDPADTGTLRPKWKPLQKAGNEFILVDTHKLRINFPSSSVLVSGREQLLL